MTTKNIVIEIGPPDGDVIPERLIFQRARAVKRPANTRVSAVSAVRRSKCGMACDDGHMVCELEGMSADAEYDYGIDARDGTVVTCECEARKTVAQQALLLAALRRNRQAVPRGIYWGEQGESRPYTGARTGFRAARRQVPHCCRANRKCKIPLRWAFCVFRPANQNCS